MREMIDGMLQAFMNRDLEGVLAYFADEAVIFDPHYPAPKMKGKAAIRQGLAWALGNMERPGFTVRHFWGSEASGVIETETNHVFKGGMRARFDQVFVFETRDGRITRLQAYGPYSPGGIAGLLARLTRWSWKLTGKVQVSG